MRIGLDLDGVVYDYAANLSRLIVADGGEPIPKDCGWFKPAELWPPYFDNPRKVFFEGDPIPGAVEGCHKLLGLCEELWLITAALPEAEVPKLDWLIKYGIEYDELIITSLDHEAEPKSAFECDLYIDDGAHNIQECFYNTRAHLIIFEQPWNKTPEMEQLEADHPQRVFRARNWQEVIPIVERVVRA